MSSYVKPLGIVILKDEEENVFEPKEGYLKEKSEFDNIKWIYNISCSLDKMKKLIWEIVQQCFIDKIVFYLGFEDEKEDFNEYATKWLSKEELKKMVEPYIFRLLNDCMITWGLVGGTSSQHEEIQIDAMKIITLMTSQESLVEEILKDNAILYDENLQFIKDHPHALMNLRAVEKFYDGYKWLADDEFLTLNYCTEIINSFSMYQQPLE